MSELTSAELRARAAQSRQDALYYRKRSEPLTEECADALDIAAGAREKLADALDEIERLKARENGNVCILDLDSPSYPTEFDEYIQCGCRSCKDKVRAEVARLKRRNDRYCNTMAKIASIVGGRKGEPCSDDLVGDTLALATEKEQAEATLAAAEGEIQRLKLEQEQVRAQAAQFAVICEHFQVQAENEWRDWAHFRPAILAGVRQLGARAREIAAGVLPYLNRRNKERAEQAEATLAAVREKLIELPIAVGRLTDYEYRGMCWIAAKDVDAVINELLTPAPQGDGQEG